MEKDNQNPPKQPKPRTPRELIEQIQERVRRRQEEQAKIRADEKKTLSGRILSRVAS